MKKLTNDTSFEDNMSHNDILSSHITVSSSILFPTHCCVQHIIVSNKILRPHLPKGSLFTFHISMCCGRIMLCLRSTSVYSKYMFLNHITQFCTTKLIFMSLKSWKNPFISYLEKMGTLMGHYMLRKFNLRYWGAVPILLYFPGGYRDALRFHPGEPITFDADAFVQSRPPSMQPFLVQMFELQIFQQV